jgi:hypothetical protein
MLPRWSNLNYHDRSKTQPFIFDGCVFFVVVASKADHQD